MSVLENYIVPIPIPLLFLFSPFVRSDPFLFLLPNLFSPFRALRSKLQRRERGLAPHLIHLHALITTEAHAHIVHVHVRHGFTRAAQLGAEEEEYEGDGPKPDADETEGAVGPFTCQVLNHCDTEND